MLNPQCTELFSGDLGAAWLGLTRWGTPRVSLAEACRKLLLLPTEGSPLGKPVGGKVARPSPHRLEAKDAALSRR